MNTLIPLEYYSFVYFNVLFLVVILLFLQSLKSDFSTKPIFGFIVFLFVLLYIGLRPISFVFNDMGVYNLTFEKYQEGEPIFSEKDIFFEYFIFYSSKIMSAQMFFFVCACLYVIPVYLASKKIFKEYWEYCFLMLVISLSFWAYGVNGIRNGIATSFFLYGISNEKKAVSILFVVLSFFIHKSLVLPCFAFFAVTFYNKPETYLKFWILSIPASVFLGDFFTNFFLGLGLVENERISGYLGELSDDLNASDLKIGFRWDFLLYSATGVFAGWYFIVKKKFEDEFYIKIFNVYLFSNAIWILVIKANFSNRFAYLSWFMLGLLIIYPFLKMKFFINQHQIMVRIIFIYFMFTYLLNVILSK